MPRGSSPRNSGRSSSPNSDKRQRAAIDAYAKTAGVEIVGEFYDAAVSGADPVGVRPGFAAMLEALLANGARTIIVESPDRFARDLMVQLAGHDLLKAKGLTLSGLTLDGSVNGTSLKGSASPDPTNPQLFDASLSGVDVLAGPTVGCCAPEQDPPFGVGDDKAESRFCGPYNLTGHPAVSIPVPVAGLPVGLQLAGRCGGDMALLRAAAGIERILAGKAGIAGIREAP